MKNIYLLLLVLFVAQPAYVQEWRLEHQFNPAQTLQKVRFRDAHFGLTVGSLYNGSTKNIHMTKDGGKTWIDASSGYTGTRFMDIEMVNDSVLYMSGNYGLIIRSVDGGNQWSTLSTGVTEQLWGLLFTSTQTGFAVGSNGIILRTLDGGEHWEIRPSGTNHLFYDVCATESGLLFASGSNILLRSENGGDSWEPVNFFPFEPPADWIRSIQFVTNEIGYACADIGRIYKTTDAGKSWTRQNSNTQEALFELDFVDENFGIVCGFNGTILKTEDGGEHWASMSCPVGTEHLYSIEMVDRNLGYICTHFGKILKLTNVSFQDESEPLHAFHRFYPNPANETLHWSLENQTNTDACSFRLLNATGQCMLSGPLVGSQGSMNLQTLAAGMYQLHILNGKQLRVEKLILHGGRP